MALRIFSTEMIDPQTSCCCSLFLFFIYMFFLRLFLRRLRTSHVYEVTLSTELYDEWNQLPSLVVRSLARYLATGRQTYPPLIICWEENYWGRQGCQLLCYCINTLVEFILFLLLIFLLGLIFLRIYVHPNSCSAFCLASRVFICL